MMLTFALMVWWFFGGSLGVRVVSRWDWVVFQEPQGDIAYSNALLVPTSIAVAGDRVFVGLENAGKTVPATLVTFNLPSDPDAPPTSPLLKPYPSMAMQGDNSMTALKNVQALQVDAQGSLWVLDSGRWDEPATARARLLVFDLRTDDWRTLEFPDSVWSSRFSFLADMVLDMSYEDMFVYIADASGALIVCSALYGDVWRVQHPAMQPFNPFTADGVTTLALSPVGNRRFLYFCTRSSKELLAVPVSELRSRTNANATVKKVGELPTSVWRAAVDSKGIVYFHLRTWTTIDSWDSRSNGFSLGNNPVYQNEKLSSFPYTTFSFDKLENLWMLVKEDKTFQLVRVAVGAKSYIFDDPDATSAPTMA